MSTEPDGPRTDPSEDGVAPPSEPQEGGGGDSGGAPPPPRLVLKRWRPYKDPPAVVREFARRLQPFPYLSASIAAVCILLYAMMLVLGYERTLLVPAAFGAEIPPLFGAVIGERIFGRGEWFRALAGTLLHGSLLHLGINMAMLLMLGRVFENLFGPRRFLVLYVVAALSGSLLGAAMRPHVASIGASGAIMGLVGAGIAFGFRHRKRVPEALRPFFGTNLVVYAVLIFSLVLLPGAPIDHWGHFGGFVGGFLGGLALRPAIFDEEGTLPPWGVFALPYAATLAAVLLTGFQMVPRIATARDKVAAPKISAAFDALRNEQPEQARAHAEEALRIAPEDPLVLYQAGQVFLIADDFGRAADVLDRFAGAVPPEAWPDDFGNDYAWALFVGRPEDRPSIARGLMTVGLALARHPRQPAYLNTQAYGLWLNGQYLDAFRTIERAMEVGGESQRPDDIYLYCMARAAIGDRAGAEAVYQDALRAYPAGVLKAEAGRVFAERWFPAGPPLGREPPGIPKLIREPVPPKALAAARAAGAKAESAPGDPPPATSPPVDGGEPVKDGAAKDPAVPDLATAPAPTAAPTPAEPGTGGAPPSGDEVAPGAASGTPAADPAAAAPWVPPGAEWMEGKPDASRETEGAF